ncbi:hypothetical protein D3C78_1919100 [compost metagenome]
MLTYPALLLIVAYCLAVGNHISLIEEIVGNIQQEARHLVRLKGMKVALYVRNPKSG